MQTIELDGGEYTPVPERVKYFRKFYPAHRLETELIASNAESAAFKATVKDFYGNIISTGHASASKTSATFKDSILELAETAAIGRALGFMDIGINSSAIASAEEVQKQQEATKQEGYAQANKISEKVTSKTVDKIERYNEKVNPKSGKEIADEMLAEKGIIKPENVVPVIIPEPPKEVKPIMDAPKEEPVKELSEVELFIENRLKQCKNNMDLTVLMRGEGEKYKALPIVLNAFKEQQRLISSGIANGPRTMFNEQPKVQEAPKQEEVVSEVGPIGDVVAKYSEQELTAMKTGDDIWGLIRKRGIDTHSFVGKNTNKKLRTLIMQHQNGEPLVWATTDNEEETEREVSSVSVAPTNEIVTEQMVSEGDVLIHGDFRIGEPGESGERDFENLKKVFDYITNVKGWKGQEVIDRLKANGITKYADKEDLSRRATCQELKEFLN